MARKLDWHDLTKLHRYQGHRMVLDNTLRLVFSPGLYSSSLLSLLFPASEFYSAVEAAEGERYPLLVGQITCSGNDLTARISFLAPDDPEQKEDYSSLVSHLAGTAAERGASQILAEVPRNSISEDILNQCGFRCYTEQQIWRIPRNFYYGSGLRSWIPASRGDNERVLSLYQRVIPGQIQHVESPPIFPKSQGLVTWNKGQLTGLVLSQFGPRGILLDILLDPGLHSLEEYLSALLFHLPYRSTRDVFVRVRSYQGRLATALENIGAQPGEQQLAVVKKMAVHYNAKQAFAVQGFEKQPDITTPISNSKVKN